MRPAILRHLLLLVSLATPPATAALTIDLDYALYTGLHDASANLVVWKGIRYAAPPLASLRWQEPQPPAVNRTAVVAGTPGPSCPQAMPAIQGMPFIPGNEDCLFLNVYAPPPPDGNATGKGLLPVVVVIHGGGYGAGDAGQDMKAFVGANGGGMVVVVVQYRLGAFGFLASPEVKKRGVLNAGLLDQRFALEWVQRHIEKFGGDPERVTIAGESAGGGSVMLHAMALEGGLGTKLFKNIIAASPWVPTQPRYDDAISVRHYTDFAAMAGCSAQGDVFDCLVGKDSLTLQYAANLVSTSPPTPRGNWAFIPVTDDSYVVGPPSIQLAKGKLNGLRLLVGNNANEGSLIPPSNIITEADLVAWIKSNFHNLSTQNITTLLAAYPSDSGPVRPSTPRFETNGYGPATAVNISQVATGQQQRCYNMYAESSVICPSYFFASAFARHGLAAYHYQYSVPFAAHGADLAAVWGPPGENQGPDLVLAFQKMYGNFITANTPSLSLADANGRSSADPSAPNPASAWPTWTGENPLLVNINQTGGRAYTVYTASGVGVTQFRGPGLVNKITVAEAYPWEGGRGARCEVWKELGAVVPQ